jgi:L-threonylcarbamoyladenylate synthase
MHTELLTTHTPELFAAAVRRAAAWLRAGEVVALPTETVYGLAANALDASAVARVFQVKGRPAHNPVIVHIASAAMARDCVQAWPELAEPLAKAFWPGPLTLVLPRAGNIPAAVAAGGGTVGIRWPAHPLMQAVIRECGFPLAAPSANLSNQISPTNAQHVYGQLAGRIPLIVDGGQSQVGIESTVLDLTVSPPRILRPGMIHAAALAAAGLPVAHPPGQASLAWADRSLKSPGLLPRHYAPKAKLVILNWRDERELQAQIGAVTGKVCIVAHTNIPAGGGAVEVSVIPHDAEAFARALYAELHRCDAAGARLIVVESPPDLPDWTGIADRLRRAAA